MTRMSPPIHKDSQRPGVWCRCCGYCLLGLATTQGCCPECGSDRSKCAIRIPRAKYQGLVRLMALRQIALWGLTVIATYALIMPGYFDTRVWYHCAIPSSQKYVSWDAFVDKQRHVVGALIQLPLSYRADTATIKLRTLERGTARMNVSRGGVEVRYTRSDGSVALCLKPLDKDVLIEWMSDLGIDTRDKLVPIEAEYISDCIRAEMQGEVHAATDSPFSRVKRVGLGSPIMLLRLWSCLPIAALTIVFVVLRFFRLRSTLIGRLRCIQAAEYLVQKADRESDGGQVKR